MESAATFFGKFSELTVFAVRWIIYFGRKYPLAAAGYLVFYAWFFFLQAKSSQTNLALPPPSIQQQTPTSSAPSAPVPAPPVPPSPVVPLAQTQAFRNGNSAIIKWSQPVSNPMLYTDGNLLQASCQPRVCTVSIPAQVKELQASWQEGGQSFKKKFRF